MNKLRVTYGTHAREAISHITVVSRSATGALVMRHENRALQHNVQRSMSGEVESSFTLNPVPFSFARHCVCHSAAAAIRNANITPLTRLTNPTHPRSSLQALTCEK